MSDALAWNDPLKGVHLILGFLAFPFLSVSCEFPALFFVLCFVFTDTLRKSVATNIFYISGGVDRLSNFS